MIAAALGADQFDPSAVRDAMRRTWQRQSDPDVATKTVALINAIVQRLDDDEIPLLAAMTATGLVFGCGLAERLVCLADGSEPAAVLACFMGELESLTAFLEALPTGPVS
jgi:hypothetical protein